MDEKRAKFQSEIRRFVEMKYKTDLSMAISIVIVVEIALLFISMQKIPLLVATFVNLAIVLWAIRSFRKDMIRRYRNLSKFTDDHWKLTEYGSDQV